MIKVGEIFVDAAQLMRASGLSGLSFGFECDKSLIEVAEIVDTAQVDEGSGVIVRARVI